MRILVQIYDKCMQLAQHPQAAKYLAAISFIDGCLLPLPPYAMLGPMALAKPQRAYQYALLATVASILGGLLGYLFGYVLFNPIILPMIKFFGYEAQFELAKQSLQAREFWAVLIAGFLPIPFKIIAISAGFLQLALLPFVFASCIGRGVKFFILVYLIKIGGVELELKLRNAIEKFGLLMMCLTLGGILVLNFW